MTVFLFGLSHQYVTENASSGLTKSWYQNNLSILSIVDQTWCTHPEYMRQVLFWVQSARLAVLVSLHCLIKFNRLRWFWWMSYQNFIHILFIALWQITQIRWPKRQKERGQNMHCKSHPRITWGLEVKLHLAYWLTHNEGFSLLLDRDLLKIVPTCIVK